jgi:hypothetical protein
MAHHRRIDHEAAVGGVLLEGALEDRIVAIGLGDGGFQIVDHHPRRHTAEVLPGVLQAVDELGDRLVKTDVDELMAAMSQCDQQRTLPAASPQGWVMP